MTARERGLSLIEMVVFIVVLGIGLVSVLALYNRAAQSSVDPLIRRQALAIATTLMEEVQLQPYTFCDPDDANVFAATGSPGGGCAVDEVLGVEGGETRYGTPRFDNVSDYNGFAMGAGAIRTIDDPTPIAMLTDYSVRIDLAATADDEAGPGVAAAEALRITVTATHVPTNTTVAIQGYRLRYAPNSP
jgi:MSHA pilin protein MshD